MSHCFSLVYYEVGVPIISNCFSSVFFFKFWTFSYIHIFNLSVSIRKKNCFGSLWYIGHQVRMRRAGKWGCRTICSFWLIVTKLEDCLRMIRSVYGLGGGFLRCFSLLRVSLGRWSARGVICMWITCRRRDGAIFLFKDFVN